MASSDFETINISDDEDNNNLLVANKEDPVVLYSCYHCNEKFINYRALDSHIKLISIKELEASLDNNAMAVFQRYCLMPDIVDVTKNKENCSKGNTEDSQVVYNCPLCSFRHTKPCQMKHHVETMHSDMLPVGNLLSINQNIGKSELKQGKKVCFIKECKLCGYKVNRIFQLTRHMIHCHAKDGYFKCNACDFKFVSAYLLNKHYKHNHRN